MKRSSDMVEALRARADDFRLRAKACKVGRYASLMRIGAAHLDEEAAQLETRLRAPRQF